MIGDELYLFRHGATEWSQTGQHTGTTDIPLLPKGRRQAEAMGRHLVGRPLARVLTSPLQRARVTCDLAGCGDRAVITGDLTEWDYGELEGLTTDQIRQSYPGWTIWDGPVPGGESLAQVTERADRVIAEVRSVNGDVAAFAHGHVLRVLAARWCDLDPGDARHLPLATGSVSVLGWEHEFSTLRVWNQPVAV
jgi:broad specificity phosphatase PhoE